MKLSKKRARISFVLRLLWVLELEEPWKKRQSWRKNPSSGLWEAAIRDSMVAALEKDLLIDINKMGIGPQGLGGTVTALEVHIETFPTHIASIPVAVNIQCHCHRHKEIIL